MKIRFFPFWAGKEKGIDLEVLDPAASVADYADALNDYILSEDYKRFRSKTVHCAGCDECCGERMPLTSIDVLKLKEGLEPQLSLHDFFNRYTYITVSGRVIDITLSRDHEDKCIFLDKENKKCTQYGLRPLVCQTYICTLLSSRASQLRKAVINSGEDELVRQWLECRQNANCVIHEAAEEDIRNEDWQSNCWTKKTSFAEVLLREIVSERLWHKLYRKG